MSQIILKLIYASVVVWGKNVTLLVSQQNLSVPVSMDAEKCGIAMEIQTKSYF